VEIRFSISALFINALVVEAFVVVEFVTISPPAVRAFVEISLVIKELIFEKSAPKFVAKKLVLVA
jgi:hypothetical protein